MGGRRTVKGQDDQVHRLGQITPPTTKTTFPVSTRSHLVGEGMG